VSSPSNGANSREDVRAARPTPRPRLLDLFCGAGGAAMGYHRAGFDVVGVDIRDQPNYPFTFIRADALDLLTSPWFDRQAFDLIHASPPCQFYSDLAHRNGNAHVHPDLIGPTRDALGRLPQKYVIENVEGAPLIAPKTLCGSSFLLGVDGYRLRRHRLFETNWPLAYLPLCSCAMQSRPIIDVSGGGPTHAPRKDGAGGRTYKGTVAQKRTAMGVDWMTGAELVESIPPDYTEAIGVEFLIWKGVRVRVAACNAAPSWGDS
jgi:DNA (cytosine-5)-methyltransferase 1